MKLNKIFLTATLLFAGVCANAQETVTEYEFQPHWFGQLQLGGQETLGEGKFGKLLSGNAQIAAGYKFNPYFGLRLGVNAWASRGAVTVPGFNNGNTNYYKWNYVAPTLDAVLDVTNIIWGYNPTRVFELNLLGGMGVNVGFHNKDAVNMQKNITSMYNNEVGLNGAWDGTKCRFLGQFGLGMNFNVSSRVQVGLELMANVTNDAYNSKLYGENTDWYFNCLVGVGYAFGPKYNKVTRVIEPAPEPVIVEKI